MSAKSPARIAFAFACASLVGWTAAACGTLADLEVKYEDEVTPTVDGGGGVDPSTAEAGRIIRDSSFVEPDGEPTAPLEASDAGPCESDSDDGGGCDFAQGLGCCLTGATSSRCIYQWEIADKCAGGVFIGCRADDPTSESACCWRTDKATNTRFTAFATSCDGGAHACLPDDAGTPGCNSTACSLTGGDFRIGSTADTPVCP